jgi:hypothetical protein
VEAAVGNGTFAKTAVMKKLDDLHSQLLADSSSPIERLLVDRVAVTWLALAIAEGVYYRSLTDGLDQNEDERHQARVARASPFGCSEDAWADTEAGDAGGAGQYRGRSRSM